MMIKKCLQCNKEYSKKYKESYAQFKIQKFCSKKCVDKARVGTNYSGWSGKKHTLESKLKMSKSQTGRKPWNKGKKHTPETIEKIKKAVKIAVHKDTYKFHSMKGYKHTEETKRKLSLIGRGKKHSIASIEKMKATALKNGHGKWNKGRLFTEEHKRKIGEQSKGRVHSLETRLKMSGKNQWNWKGGITPMNEKIRHSHEYKLWRKSVFERDNYTCIWCGFKGFIQADHIKPFSLYPELRFAIDNGRTLCRDCHKKTDTYGVKKLKLNKIYGKKKTTT